jgi:sulfite exporter TauE/SafE
MNKLSVSFFLMGLTLGFGPCLASCGPLLISYLAGTQKSVYSSSLAYIVFSLSRILAYLALGVLIFLFGEFGSKYMYGSFSRYVYIFAGIFIIIIGVLMASGRSSYAKFCRRLSNLLLKKDIKTIFLLGLIIGIMPCLPLISVLSYIALVSKTFFDSLLYSFCFGLGTAISPLFLLSALTGLIPALLLKHSKFYAMFNSVCGLIIAGLGTQLIIRGFR